MALMDIDARPEGSPGGIASLPPSILKPELERNVQEHEPTTFTLVREAGEARPPYAKVLAHELIAESEKKSMDHWMLPPVQGGISGSGLSFSSPLPIPVLQGFIPVDFLLQGGPGHLSVSPKIQMHKDQGDDRELYH